MKKRKAADGVRRDAPDLPAELEAGSWGEGEFVSLEERQLADVERPGARIGELRIEGSVLERVQLGGSEIGAMVLKDVRFVGCDLANVRAHRLSLLRVAFIDCRLTGFAAAATEWKDVLVEGGDLRYAQMQGGSFGNCEFAGCNWQDADVQRADLSGCVIRGCDLGRADFRGARLRDADLRQSEVEGMVAEVGDLQGAIVAPAQAMVFARLMGLQIR